MPKRSRLYLGLIGISHGIAALGSIANNLPLLWRIIILVIVAISYRITLKNYLFNTSKPTLVIAHNDSEGWSLQAVDSPLQYVGLLPSSVTTRIVTLLHFEMDNRQQRTIPIFKDSLDKECYRKLRVLLKVLMK